MMDFMSHLVESMLCREISRSPGVSGDTVELPSPVGRGREVGGGGGMVEVEESYEEKNFNMYMMHRINLLSRLDPLFSEQH